MLKADPKTSNLATLQNFDMIEKMDTGFGISNPKLINLNITNSSKVRGYFFHECWETLL